MRRILIERARRKARLKHGGGWQRLAIEHINLAAPGNEDSVLFVGEALEELARQDSVCAELVKLHFFSAVSYQEAELRVSLEQVFLAALRLAP